MKQLIQEQMQKPRDALESFFNAEPGFRDFPTARRCRRLVGHEVRLVHWDVNEDA